MTFKEENDLTGKNGSCLVRAKELALLLFISWSLLKLLAFLLFCCENSIEKVGGMARVFSIKLTYIERNGRCLLKV